MTIFAKITRTDGLRKGSFNQVCSPFKARGAHYIQSPLGYVRRCCFGALRCLNGNIRPYCHLGLAKVCWGGNDKALVPARSDGWIGFINPNFANVNGVHAFLFVTDDFMNNIWV